MKRIVLLGGGHSQLAVLARLALEPASGAEVVLVNPSRHAVYSGRVPGWIAGDCEFDDCRIDLQPLARGARARLVESRAVALDAEAHRVLLEDGRHLDYDLLSLDVGSTAATAGIAGAELAIALRPIEALPGKIAGFDARVRAGRVRRIAMAGAGAAGVEVLLTLLHRANAMHGVRIDAVLVTDADGVLPGHGERVRRLAERELARRGVELRTGLVLQAVEPGGMVLSDRHRPAGPPVRIEADMALLATGAAPHDWLASSSLVRDERGFVAVDTRLRSVSHREVFAAGDCATSITDPRPKSGVQAVRQGPVLAANLLAASRGGAAGEYSAPRRPLAILNLGGRRAMASWKGVAFRGGWVWRWKERLDRGFLARYRRDPGP